MLTITTEIRKAIIKARRVSIRNNRGKGSLELFYQDGAQLNLQFDGCQERQIGQWHDDYAYQEDSEFQIVKQIIRKGDQIRFTFCSNLYRNNYQTKANLDQDTISMTVVRGNQRFTVPISHECVPKDFNPAVRMCASL